MGHRSDTRFLVLHGLRLKGFAEPPAVAAAVGLDDSTVSEHIAKLQADDLVLRRDGRLSGFTLTPAGRLEQQRLAREDVAAPGAEHVVRDGYQRFLALNRAVLRLCTDWQLKGGAPNDHTDAAYDAGVIDRLREIHDGVVRILGDLTAALARFELYAPRFADAMARLDAGELEFLTKPLIDSFHTIWFELHEDLLTTLGIERSHEADA